MWLRIGPLASSCEHGNEPSGPIKCVKFLDYLSDCYLLQKDSAPWSQSFSLFSELWRRVVMLLDTNVSEDLLPPSSG
jgi:hypothetical protein